ncbi:MAG: alpha/beta hydrolase [Candidatus Wolfebacteria bacterium]|nr:alpha/beta hydrolase [Candidatus Wolfebacteria bacterium]
MKNAIILHGTGDKPKDFWFPYLKKELKARGYRVWLPQLPNAEKPNIQDWLSFILKNGKFSNDTVIIGHSSGSQIILSILENIKIKVKQVILVSGYAKLLPQDQKGKKLGNPDWKKIKKHAQNFVFINSDNDPWGCNDKQGRIMFNNLGGILIINHEWHMGSTTYKQPYKKFPLLVKLITNNF